MGVAPSVQARTEARNAGDTSDRMWMPPLGALLIFAGLRRAIPDADTRNAAEKDKDPEILSSRVPHSSCLFAALPDVICDGLPPFRSDGHQTSRTC